MLVSPIHLFLLLSCRRKVLTSVYSTIEGAVAIMVGCAPALRTFWGAYVTKSTVNGTKQSSKAIRHHSLSGNTPRHPGWQGSQGSQEYMNTVPQNSSYIRMEPR